MTTEPAVRRPVGVAFGSCLGAALAGAWRDGPARSGLRQIGSLYEWPIAAAVAQEPLR
jgi:hypothetical protein